MSDRKPVYQILYKRVKYPSITIKPDSKICLRVPLFFTPLEVQALIERYQDWINQALAKFAHQAILLNQEIQEHDGEILLFGEWMPLSSLPLSPSSSSLSSSFSSSSLLSSSLLSSSLPHGLKPYLKARLQEYLFPQVAHYSKLMGVEFVEIRITNALSRFGSCTYDNRLFFSLMLVFAPHELITYVVIHELAHIRHKNHSKSFWEFVERFCPDCKALRASLRKKARIYPKLMELLK